MKIRKLAALAVLPILLTILSPSQASLLVYDSLKTSSTATISALNTEQPVFGDTLTLASGGMLATMGLSLANPSDNNNTGYIIAGIMTVTIYDNTIAYSGGTITNPLVGTAAIPLNFSAYGGIPPGYYVDGSFDVSGLHLILPQEILITQQFTMTDGDSILNGVELMSDPITGSSPNTIYRSSTMWAPGLSSFTGNPGQVSYQITVVPEPSICFLLGLGIGGLGLVRRKARQA